MDNLEKELFELNKNDFEIPEEVSNKINMAFDEIRSEEKGRKKNKHMKKTYIAAAGLALAVMIGTSTPVKAIVEKFIFNFYNTGVEEAAKQDYVQHISDKKISTSKYDIELKNILVDRANIALDFELNIHDKNLLENTKYMDANIELYDDKGNVVDKDGVAGAIGGTKYSINYKDIENNKLGLNVLYPSDSAEIPKINGLKIVVKDIFFRNPYEDKAIEVSRNLNWEMNINLDGKFAENREVPYKAVTESKNFKVNNAMALPTGMFIDINYFPQGHYENLMHKITLVDDNGNRYKSSGSARMNTLTNGGDSYQSTFQGLSSFTCTDSFTIEIENPDGVTVDKIRMERQN